MSTGPRFPLDPPSVVRMLNILDSMEEGAQVLESELVVSALREDTEVSAWTRVQLRSISDSVASLRRAIKRAPQRPHEPHGH